MSAVRRLGSREAERLARRAASGLRRRGLRSGDRVALVGSSGVETLAVALGALRSGVIPVVPNALLLPDELAAILDDADPARVLDDAAILETLEGPEGELAPHPLGRPMYYTSGTTGTPKGVWTGVLDEAEAAALHHDEAELWRFDSADRNLVVSPLHHSAPFRFAAGTLLEGGEILLPGKFGAAKIREVVAKERPTTAFMVPTHLGRIFDTDELPDFSCFRLLAHAGAPCPEPLKRRLIEIFPEGSVWEFYGSTEGQFTACSSREWEERPGTVGRARPSRRLEVDDEGVIWCHVPPWARFSYWRDEEKTRSAWRGDAFTVRDVGRLDDDGYLFLEGRRDDLVISGGVNLYPAEIERALLARGGVGELAVFPVPDDDWGQALWVAYTGDVEPAAILEWSRSQLAPHKRPKQAIRVDAIPLTSTGKVRRSTLAEDLGIIRGAG